MSFLYKNFTTTILLCILIVILIRYYWRRRRLYYYASKVPGPPAWPIIGNALSIAANEDIVNNIMNILATYKSPQRLWLGPKLLFTISKPKDLEIVLTEALDKEDVYNFLQPIIGLGLITGPIDIWRRHRRVIVPTFNQRNLNSFVTIFDEHSQIAVKKLRNDHDGKGTFDVSPILKKCIVDIVCETAMGKSVRGKTDEFIDAAAKTGEKVYLRMFQVWMHIDFIWNLTPHAKILDHNMERIRQFLSTIIKSKKQEYRRSNKGNEHKEFDEVQKKKPFLDYLLELSEEGENWTDDELRDETSTVMIAATDTTGKTLSFAMVMLGMYPDLQEKVYQEICDIFGDSNRECTPEDLAKMIYLERFLKETSRLFPTGPVLGRRLEQDIQLDSYLLPKGSSCALMILYTHRDPEIWPEPMKFDPDRFLPEQVAKRHPYSYLPFSGGPRNCIGIKYAMMSLKTIIATIVRNFHIYTDYKRIEDIKLKADVTLVATDGWKVSVKSRKLVKPRI